MSMTEPKLNDLRQQWLDLQARHGSGALAAEAYTAERAALEQRIVAAVVEPAAASPSAADSASAPPASSVSATAPLPETPPTPPVPAPAGASRVPGRRLWGVAAAFVLVLAVLGYGWKGTPQAVGTPPPGFEQQQAGAPGAPQRTGAEELDTLVKQLKDRLDKQPGDVEGWRLLARSQMTLGRFAEAAAAYERAMAIKADDPSTLTDYADALGVLNGRTLEGEPARLLERALKLDPRHVKALVLVGTLEFQRGNYGAAQKRWEEVLRIGPAGDGLVELAREGVTQAQTRQRSAAAGGVAGAAPAQQAQSPATVASAAAAVAPAGQGPQAAPAPPAAAGPGISGTVRLAAALKSQAAPGDVVFIFARATGGAGAGAGGGGGGMPLAIVQKRVADLPATFMLDDSQAMSPAARLSSAQQVVITARISKSGQATPQLGDMEGISVPVAPGARARRGHGRSRRTRSTAPRQTGPQGQSVARERQGLTTAR